MPFPPLIEDISPETIGEDRIALRLTDASQFPRAFRAVNITVDYGACAPDGVVLPLELLIQAPSSSGFRRTVLRRAAPASISFVPREGGVHFVLLREQHHNRWLGKLRVAVAGDPLNPSPDVGFRSLPTTSPASLPGLVTWLRSSIGITYGGTLLATGTAPPVVTLTGTGGLMGLRLEIQTTAARGTAQFRYSADNGATWIEQNVVTAATYAMIGAAAGYILNFPVGTYTNNDVYVNIVTAWADQSGLGHDAMQASGPAQPSFSTTGGPNGRPCVVGNGAQFLATSPFALNQPTTVLLVAKYNTTFAAAQTRLMDGNATNNLAITRAFSDTRIDIYAGSFGALVDPVSTTSWHYYTCVFNNTAGALTADNGVPQIGACGTNNAGGIQLLGPDTGAGFAVASIAEVIVYNRLLSATDTSRLHTYLSDRYLL